MNARLAGNVLRFAGDVPAARRGGRKNRRGGGYLVKWGGAAVFPLAAWLTRGKLDSWVFMWAMAFGLFAAAKWITIAPLLKRNVPTRRLLSYAILWPGLNARAFLSTRMVAAPEVAEWRRAVLNVVAGAVLVAVAFRALPVKPLAGGWLGMIGLVLTLHFGVFHMVSLAWRAHGVNAAPLMRHPLAAESVAKLWSGRWNTGFSDLMHGHFLPPLARRFGMQGGICAIFLISGALHELVITLPAGGGYGLPTAYFLLQGAATVLEKSEVGRKWKLADGLRGRCFAVLVAAAPVGLLFPAVFVRNVIIPMMEVAT